MFGHLILPKTDNHFNMQTLNDITNHLPEFELSMMT